MVSMSWEGFVIEQVAAAVAEVMPLREVIGWLAESQRDWMTCIAAFTRSSMGDAPVTLASKGCRRWPPTPIRPR